MKSTMSQLHDAAAPMSAPERSATGGVIDACDLSPIALADLMLAIPFLDAYTSATLEPSLSSGDNAHVLTLRRERSAVQAFLVDDEVAAAAVVRIARAGQIELLAETELGTALARIRLRDGARSAEALVSIRARSAGFFVEVLALTRDGAACEKARSSLRQCPTCGALTPAFLARCEVDGSPLEDVVDAPYPGGSIGLYRIESEIGSGAMGTVFAARHVVVDRAVALKLLHRTVGTDVSAERRFLFEAQAASRLRHPNVVEIYDCGVLDDGRPYFVMERLRGRALDALLEERGALELNAALRIGIGVGRALVAAHELGILHNDVKPSNVVILDEGKRDTDPVLKLVDFGAAMLLEQAVAAGEPIYGTPPYMSPERAAGDRGDARSDVFSLGAMIYELISGQVPFSGSEISGARGSKRERQAAALTTPKGPPPASVARVVARALRLAPNERQASARELVSELERALETITDTSWKRWLQ